MELDVSLNKLLVVLLKSANAEGNPLYSLHLCLHSWKGFLLTRNSDKIRTPWYHTTHSNGLHRGWRRMLKTVYVVGNFKMLVTNSLHCTMLPTCQWFYNWHLKTATIVKSPTSLFNITAVQMNQGENPFLVSNVRNSISEIGPWYFIQIFYPNEIEHIQFWEKQKYHFKSKICLSKKKIIRSFVPYKLNSVSQ